jgi:hypothetical protein
MNPSRPLLVGLPLVAALGVWFLRSPDDGAHKPPPRAAAEPAVLAPDVKPTAEAPSPTEPLTEPAKPAPTPDVDPKRENAQAILAEGEANRIAAREARYAKLDWDAPRPGPPPPRDPVVGKREAKLSAGDKLEQTEQMISLLKTRIAHTRARAGASDTRLLERLEKRVGELNATAQVLRKEHEASGSAPPAGDSGSSVPDGSGAHPHG